ncbi:MAG: HpcH/HpaI aldolase/citrate lyase family protein [Acetivibrionales bacterium]|jgi:citrate lyase subunit beta/citryl-CoA lyase
MSIVKPINPYRSNLIMPLHKMKYVEKSYLRDADVVTLDLEDSVLPSEKDEARKNAKIGIEIAGRGGADVLVRINSERENHEKDLQACIYPGLSGISVPKVESVWEVMNIERIIGELEIERGIEPGTIETLLAVETARGYLEMERIVAASKRATSLCIGQEDFSRDIGIEMPNGDELTIPNFNMVIIAIAYGLRPLGLVASLTDYKDLEQFSKIVDNSSKIGIVGAACIHPAQVPYLNKGFSPPHEEVEYAKRVLEIFEESKRRGDGAISLDGKMIDRPVVDRAMKVLQRQKRIDDFQAYKQKMLGMLS